MQPEATNRYTPEYTAIRDRHQRAWASIGSPCPTLTQALMVEELCEAMNLMPGDRVLDVAAGYGVASLSAARRGCEVTSTDFVTTVLDVSRQRAELEGLLISYQPADAEALPFIDGQFDSVISTFGVCCSPDPHRVIGELLRVCRPGGVIGLLNWSHPSILTDLFGLLASGVSRSALSNTLLHWADGDKVRSMLSQHQHSTHITTRKFFHPVSIV